MPARKRCSSCHAILPPDDDLDAPITKYFYRNASHDDKLGNICKACERATKKAKRAESPPKRRGRPPKEKTDERK